MKKLSALLSILLFMAILYSCAAPQPPGGGGTPTPTPTPSPSQFGLDARVQKASFAIGEMVTVTVRAEKTSYLTIFSIGADGEIARIFPNSFASNNYIEGGTIYHVPSSTDQFGLQVSGPRGTEQMRVIATLEPVSIVEPRELTRDAFPKFNGTVEEFEQVLEEQLSALPVGSWATANITFQVQ